MTKEPILRVLRVSGRALGTDRYSRPRGGDAKRPLTPATASRRPAP